MKNNSLTYTDLMPEVCMFFFFFTSVKFVFPLKSRYNGLSQGFWSLGRAYIPVSLSQVLPGIFLNIMM